MPGPEQAAVGDEVASRTVTVDQAALIAYAGASGDRNPLHWDPAFAAAVSPTGGVIVHGMLSMGVLSALVTDWAGGPERIRSLSATFKAPCPVGATVAFGATVTAVDREAGTVTLALSAVLPDGAKVVDRGRSRAVVALD